MSSPRRPLIALLLAAAFGLTTVAGAQADSLVFIKEGEVWISHGDGSNPRQVTGAPNNWSWPTEDDGRHILVAGGPGEIRAGVEDTPGSEIYRLDQQGSSLSTPQRTPGSLSTVACPSYPPVGLRVAPDGQHYAYHAFTCAEDVTEVGTVGGQGFTAGDRMDGFVFPYWISNSLYVVSRGGDPGFGGCDPGGGQYACEWWTREVGQQADYGYPWFSDAASTATGFDGLAVTRDGTKFASIEDDAADYLGAAHNVELRLWTASGAPSLNAEPPAPTFRCQVSLPADPNTTLWFDNAGPTFSPDDTHLAFAEPDGIHIMDVSNLGNCAGLTAPLAIPGATQPFWSAADEEANAGFRSPRQGEEAEPVLSDLSVTPRRFAVAKGATVRYTVSEPATVAFEVVRVQTGRRKGKRCVPATRALRTAPRCVLTHRVSTFTRNATGGGDSFPFPARVGRRALGPGKYRLIATPTDAAGHRGKSQTTGFTIVRPRRGHR